MLKRFLSGPDKRPGLFGPIPAPSGPLKAPIEDEQRTAEPARTRRRGSNEPDRSEVKRRGAAPAASAGFAPRQPSTARRLRLPLLIGAPIVVALGGLFVLFDRRPL